MFTAVCYFSRWFSQYLSVIVQKKTKEEGTLTDHLSCQTGWVELEGGIGVCGIRQFLCGISVIMRCS